MTTSERRQPASTRRRQVVLIAILELALLLAVAYTLTGCGSQGNGDQDVRVCGWDTKPNTIDKSCGPQPDMSGTTPVAEVRLITKCLPEGQVDCVLTGLIYSVYPNGERVLHSTNK